MKNILLLIVFYFIHLRWLLINVNYTIYHQLGWTKTLANSYDSYIFTISTCAGFCPWTAVYIWVRYKLPSLESCISTSQLQNSWRPELSGITTSYVYIYIYLYGWMYSNLNYSEVTSNNWIKFEKEFAGPVRKNGCLWNVSKSYN